jgi:hypothetical protein
MYWFSISINAIPGGVIFNGFFSVDAANKVTGFYETIDNTTNFNKNIYVNNGYNNETSNFDKAQNLFNPGSTNINNMYYFSNINGGGYNSSYAYFSLYTADLGPMPGMIILPSMVILNSSGGSLGNFNMFQSIQSVSDPSCFNEGTKILCLNNNLAEEYILIENLRKGDLVKSYKHGYRKIDLIGKNPMINNPEKFNECMYKMEKTDENGLIDDLIVTGWHAVLVDDLGICKEENDKIFGTTPMIDDKYLLLSSLSKDFVKLENTNLYTYYHFILENNGNDDERFGVWANGILTETTSKNQFANHKYTLL